MDVEKPPASNEPPLPWGVAPSRKRRNQHDSDENNFTIQPGFQLLNHRHQDDDPSAAASASSRLSDGDAEVSEAEIGKPGTSHMVEDDEQQSQSSSSSSNRVDGVNVRDEQEGLPATGETPAAATAAIIHQSHNHPAATPSVLRINDDSAPGAFLIHGYRATTETDTVDSEDVNTTSELISPEILQLHHRMESLQRRLREAESAVAVEAEVVPEHVSEGANYRTLVGRAIAEDSDDGGNIPLVEAHPINWKRIYVAGGCMLVSITALVVVVVLVLVLTDPIGGGGSISTAVPAIQPTAQPTPAPSGAFKCFDDTEELTNILDSYLTGGLVLNSTLARIYGWRIGTWCTANVTSMFSLFDNTRNVQTTTFNEDISGWDVSRVTNMSNMFSVLLPLIKT